METPARDLCLRCHTAVVKGLAFVHGPALLDCLVCHEVHKGRTRALLINTDANLCLTCHYDSDTYTFSETEEHREVNKERAFACMYCHDPHGGQDKFYKRQEPFAYTIPQGAGDNETFSAVSDNGSDIGSDDRLNHGVIIESSISDGGARPENDLFDNETEGRTDGR